MEWNENDVNHFSMELNREWISLRCPMSVYTHLYGVNDDDVDDVDHIAVKCAYITLPERDRTLN